MSTSSCWHFFVRNEKCRFIYRAAIKCPQAVVYLFSDNKIDDCEYKLYIQYVNSQQANDWYRENLINKTKKKPSMGFMICLWQ